MVAVTYGVARVSADKATERAQAAAPRKSFFARIMDAIIESQMRKARREIAMHAHLLPYSLDERGNRLAKLKSDEMPFGGW